LPRRAAYTGTTLDRKLELLLLLLLLLLFAQVGGLGDVVTSLAKAHQATGTLVEVIMPKYDCANYRWASQTKNDTVLFLGFVALPFGGGAASWQMHTGGGHHAQVRLR
jgi:hypothetical protein